MRRSLKLHEPHRQVSIVSFNMLLKAFDTKPYYPGVCPELRSWPGRKQHLKLLLLSLNADIYCMQEVECSSFLEEFSFLADEGYAFVSPRDDSKGKRPGLAKCAIFYKADCLEKVWEEHRSRIVLAALRHVSTGQLLYVASCHLEGAPWEAATRVKQMINALDALQKHQKEQQLESSKCALVIAGDFNETEDGAVCHCLHSGGLRRDFRLPRLPEQELLKDDYEHGFKLADLYSSEASALGERPPTFCAPADETCEWKAKPTFAAVDFIFYTSSTLRPVAVRRPFTEEQMAATEGQGIPSEWHFSDHVPIGGVFDLVSDSSDGSQVELV